VNAAFLLVTTAWFAGADAAPSATAAPATTTPATVVAPGAVGAAGALGGGSCCGGGAAYGGGCCDSCCDTCCAKQGCLAKMKARMHRNSCCDCCNTCNTCGTTCCNTGCGGGHGGGCGSNYASSCGTCGGCCETCCCPKQGLCARLKAKMHSSNCCNTCCDTCGGCGTGCGTGCGAGGVGGSIYTAPSAMPPAGEPIKAPKDKDAGPGQKLPSGKVLGQPLDVTPTSSAIETETKNPFELDRRYESRVGRAADYSWVTGQLFYVHADGGLWVLRYAPLWKEDPNGGSVILNRDRQMDSYREGDLVKVHGEILNQKGSIFLGGPLYRTDSIELVDRNAR
jgi:hypothetical protein